MKIQLAVFSAILVLIATGCGSTGALSGLAGAGESWKFINPKVSIVGTTVNISADEWIHIGTNGFPIPGVSTNGSALIPAGTLLQVR